MSDILILRPEPGASRTAARAGALGLQSVVAPLFQIRRLEWTPPPASSFDGLLVTSANALGFGGLEPCRHLTCYAVGETTAEAAMEAGFTDIKTGPSDGRALLELAAGAGARHLLHLTGRDHMALSHPEISIETIAVYAAEAVDELPAEASDALKDGALALLHSPRAAYQFATLADATSISRNAISILSISGAALEAAGEGWKVKHVAPAPRDEALLELAAKLCHKRAL
ncbi:MAG TPA: uroporphyrinogen-III synthase [Allosphingosinicella sp.]|uniref:uroporphyrinogen-III synthase n=1 Tax=Allosphingosinicella sp. TaxID=2823234 RepID=UPI002EDA28F8